jgi:hypothetical protein
MLKAIYAVIAAAILAASFFTALSISAEVEARGSVPGSKSDRADARLLGGACSQHPWPYFEAGCLRDTRNPFGESGEVRLVSLNSGASAVQRDLRFMPTTTAAPEKPRNTWHIARDKRADGHRTATVR